MHTIFKQSDLEKFRQAILQYCEKLKYKQMCLTDNELLQLSWTMGNSITTPEVSIADILEKLNFEIQRGLARRYSFELLLRRDADAYEEFVQAHNKKLSIEDFNTLAKEVQSLDKDMQAAIKVSCFLVTSERAKEELAEIGIVLSDDSEEFLSQFAQVAKDDRKIFPITSSLNTQHLIYLQKLYWPNMHLRHMLYTEGGIAMTQSFKQGIKEGTFDQNAFTVWKWRWLTNLFGFQSGPGAKYYDATTHLLSSLVLSHLEKMLINPAYSYLENYLATRAQFAGLNKVEHHLNQQEQYLLAHIAAYYHRITILTPELGAALVSAYTELRDKDALVRNYENQRNDLSAITPTYLPAVVNNAFDYFNKTKSASESIYQSCLFMLQLLQMIFTLPHNIRISCLKLADKKTLEPVLDNWLQNKNSFEFKVDEKFEVQVHHKGQLATPKFC